MKYKGFLFDKDGTLLEFHNMWLNVARRASQEIKIISDKANGQLTVSEKDLLFSIGIENDVVDNYGLLASNPVEDTALAWFNLLQPEIDFAEFSRLTKTIFNQQVLSNPTWIKSIPDVDKKLKQWKQQGIKLGIATADTKDSTLFTLKQAGLIELFDYIGYSDGDINPKPLPDLLNNFCTQCQLNPQDVIMFGDTVSDLEFAHNGGASCVGVLTGTASREELSNLANLVVESVTHFDLNDIYQHYDKME